MPAKRKYVPKKRFGKYWKRAAAATAPSQEAKRARTVNTDKQYNQAKFRNSYNLSLDIGTTTVYSIYRTDTTHMTTNADSSLTNFVIPGNQTAGDCNYAPFCIVPKVKDLQNFNALASLYDEFRVDWLRINFRPVMQPNCLNQIGASGVGSGCGGFLHMVLDFNDVALPTDSITGVKELGQYSSYKCVRLGDAASMFYKPQVQGAVYNGASALVVGNTVAAGWIPFGTENSTPINLYGVKCIAQMSASGSASDQLIQYEITCTYGITCRGCQ